MRPLARLLALYRPYAGWVALSLVIALATLLANIALMAVSGWFIAAMAVAGAAGGSINYFTPAAIIRACAILRTGGRYVERVVSHETTFRLLSRLRVWLYRRLEPQPPSVLDAYHSGDLASRLRADIDRLETVYLRVIGPVVAAAAAVAVLLAVVGRYSWAVAAVTGMCLAVAGLAVPLAVGRASAPLSRRRVILSTRLTEASVDTVQGLGELLAFGGDRHRARLLAVGGEMVAAQVRLSRLAGLSQAALLAGSNLALWGVVVVAVPLVRDGGLDGADFVMLSMLALAAFEAVAPLPGAFQALAGARESAARLFGLAGAGTAAPSPKACAAVPQATGLRLAGVTFRYRDDGRPVLVGFDLDLPPGGRVAVVGPTGRGKSTLVGLATGLLSPQAGMVTLGGRPVQELDPEELRRRFAVAPQAASLFTGTIASNLRLARPGAADGALWEVLRTVGLEDFVRARPDGLETFVGEAGLTLSGGQARRLSVARALLKDAPILILDEPGEGLDYRSERALLDAVTAALGSRSLLLITHRTAGLDRMDAVVDLGGAI